jgi:hypothetical protein
VIRFWSCADCNCTPMRRCSARRSRTGSSPNTAIEPRSGRRTPRRIRASSSCRRCLADQAEDFAAPYIERHAVHRPRRPYVRMLSTRTTASIMEVPTITNLRGYTSGSREVRRVLNVE